MITATSDELNSVRSWIGSNESEATFNERFDRLYRQSNATDDTVRRAEALNLAIEESLRSQLTEFLVNPASISADGNSMSTGQNMISMEKKLKEFRDLKGSMHANVTRLRRYHGR